MKLARCKQIARQILGHGVEFIKPGAFSMRPHVIRRGDQVLGHGNSWHLALQMALGPSLKAWALSEANKLRDAELAMVPETKTTSESDREE